MTPSEAAEVLGLTTERVLQFIRQGRLDAELKGRSGYLIHRGELERFRGIDRKRSGRPRKVLVGPQGDMLASVGGETAPGGET